MKKQVNIFVSEGELDGDGYDDNVNVNFNDNRIDDRNIAKIPDSHKHAIKQNATSYYIYFYTLLSKDLCTEDTEVADGYSVKDLIIFIIEDCWGLDISGSGQNIMNNQKTSKNPIIGSQMPFRY